MSRASELVLATDRLCQTVRRASSVPDRLSFSLKMRAAADLLREAGNSVADECAEAWVAKHSPNARTLYDLAKEVEAESFKLENPFSSIEEAVLEVAEKVAALFGVPLTDPAATLPNLGRLLESDAQGEPKARTGPSEPYVAPSTDES